MEEAEEHTPGDQQVLMSRSECAAWADWFTYHASPMVQPFGETSVLAVHAQLAQAYAMMALDTKRPL